MGKLHATAGTEPERQRGLAGLLAGARALTPLLLLAGCADRHLIRRTCPPPVEHLSARPAPHPDYRIGCPDVLDVGFAARPDWDAIASVDLDGRLPLDDAGRPRVEGLTVAEARDAIARTANVPADGVRVRLAAPRAAHVYVHGPTRGRQRVLPYQGAETVVEFLRRVGGLPPGSKLGRVYVVRPHVAAGGAPEVFHIEAEAVLEGDRRTDIPLMPSDEVYVGETSRASFVQVLPEWLRPLYRQLAGLWPESLALPFR